LLSPNRERSRGMIPRLWVDNFTAGINAISKKARKTLANLLASIDMGQDVTTVREQAVQAMQGVCGTSTQGAAMLAAEFYNGIRQYELGETIDATFDSGREPEATEGAVRAFAQKLVDGKQDEFVDACLDRADYEVKVAAAQTCVNNAKIDPKKPRFARVPSGEDTCEFCLMLASRGFVYHTEVTASHAHANCDCRIIPSWKSEVVEGYDPDELYALYKDNYRKKCSDIDSRLARPAREFRRREKYLQKHAEQMSDDEVAEYERSLRELYHEKIESYIESFSKDGLIHAKYGAIPYGKEILAGKVLASKGRDVTYLREVDENGIKNIDTVIDGKLFELKCVEQPKDAIPSKEPMRYVESNYRRAIKQFEEPHFSADGETVVSNDTARIVFDSRGRDDNDQDVEAELRKRNASGKAKTILMIGQYEDIIDI